MESVEPRLRQRQSRRHRNLPNRRQQRPLGAKQSPCRSAVADSSRRRQRLPANSTKKACTSHTCPAAPHDEHERRGFQVGKPVMKAKSAEAVCGQTGKPRHAEQGSSEKYMQQVKIKPPKKSTVVWKPFPFSDDLSSFDDDPLPLRRNLLVQKINKTAHLRAQNAIQIQLRLIDRSAPR